MTETEIIRRLARWLDNREYPYQLPNSFMYMWECDYWAMDSKGVTREFEIKISHSDFLVDAKKDKHKDVSKGANYFYYVCPENVIAKEEVDKRYGLIYITSYGLVIMKKPKRLHDTLFEQWQMLANKMYWKWFSLWEEKKRLGEISHDEYRAGFFNTELQLEEA